MDEFDHNFLKINKLRIIELEREQASIMDRLRTVIDDSIVEYDNIEELRQAAVDELDELLKKEMHIVCKSKDMNRYEYLRMIYRKYLGEDRYFTTNNFFNMIYFDSE